MVKKESFDTAAIPIEELAAKSDFIETAYLLINGELPNAKQAEDFRVGIREHTMIHEDMRSFYNGFPRDAHPDGDPQ